MPDVRSALKAEAAVTVTRWLKDRDSAQARIRDFIATDRHGLEAAPTAS